MPSITVSHNEILQTCLHLLEARGFSQGVWEDGADSVAWLAQIGVPVLPMLCAALDRLHAVEDERWQLRLDRPNRFQFTTHNGSCVQLGGLAADLARTKAQQHGYAIGSLDGTERNLWIGYLRHVAQSGLHCAVVWQHGAECHRYRFAANQPFPDYLCERVDTPDDGLVTLAVSQEPLPLAWEAEWMFSRETPQPPQIVARIKSAEFAARRQQHLYNGMLIEAACWLRLKEAAKGILVEESAGSRQHGAGGV